MRLVQVPRACRSQPSVPTLVVQYQCWSRAPRTPGPAKLPCTGWRTSAEDKRASARRQGLVDLPLGATNGFSLLQKYVVHRGQSSPARHGPGPPIPCNDLIGWAPFPDDPGTPAEGLARPLQRASFGSTLATVRPHRRSTWARDPRPYEPHPRAETSWAVRSTAIDSGLYPRARAWRAGRPCGGSGSRRFPRIVYYIRSQESFVESYYLQTVHRGRSRSFDSRCPDRRRRDLLGPGRTGPGGLLRRRSRRRA